MQVTGSAFSPWKNGSRWFEGNPKGKWGPERGNLGPLRMGKHTVSYCIILHLVLDVPQFLKTFIASYLRSKTGAQSFPGPSPASHINCEHDAIVLILGFNWLDPLFFFGNLRHPVQNSSIRDVWIQVTEYKSQWWFNSKIFQVRCLKSLGWWFKYPRTILVGWGYPKCGRKSETQRLKSPLNYCFYWMLLDK